jgi:hypothetical protein
MNPLVEKIVCKYRMISVKIQRAWGKLTPKQKMIGAVVAGAVIIILCANSC